MLRWLKARPRRILGMICVVGSLVPAVLYLTEQRYFRLEEQAQDFLATNKAASRSIPSSQLVFLGIDKSSIDLDELWPEELDKSQTLQVMKRGWPWNRKVYADILDRLVGAGAKAVVFDIRFPATANGDDAFRDALERHKDRAVIGSNLISVAERTATEGVSSVKPTHELPARTLIPVGETSDRRVGFVNVRPDPGNVVRHILYRTKLSEFAGKRGVQDPELLSLASRALQQFGAEEKVPATRNPVRIRFAEDILPRPIYEIFVDDLWNSPPYNSGEFFRDKIVLIGASGNQAEDRLTTPFGTVLGPTIHLSAINAALKDDFLTDLPIWGKLAVIATGGLLAWLIGAGIRRPLLRLACVGGAVFAYFGSAVLAFNTLGLYPLLLSPLLALTISSVTWIAFEQVLERREKTRIRKTLERYVSRDVVKEVLDNPASFLNALGGQRRDITVLFSDVRNFTSMTESAGDEHRLVAQLNEYFQEMVRIVFAHQGRLDKFIGDAVMADWGSIVTQGVKTDTHQAVSTALEMRAALARLNAGWAQRNLPPLSFGIGVNHGSAIVGNLGCEEKMEMTVIGDAVNTSSRLEGATKPYRVDICLGESAAEMVRDSFVLRSLDMIVLKGKSKPVEVFTVVDRRNGSDTEPAWLPAHEEAMQLYRHGKFAEAERCWREVLAQNPGDGVSTLFIERCVELQKAPPAEPWTGVFEMKTK